MNAFRLLILISIASIMFACSKKQPHFTVEGTILGADSSTLYLEKRELNKITFLDSLRLDSKGEFRFEHAAASYPEFFVIHLNGQVINFAIDSTETVQINASKKNFATHYSIEGSKSNQLIKEATLTQYNASKRLNDLQSKFVKKEMNEEAYLNEARTIVNEYKDAATKIIFSDLKSPAAYFALFQKVNGFLFFDPYDKNDYKMYAAVATSWNEYHKESPRSPHLRDYTLIAMKMRKQEETNPSELIDSANEIESSQYYNIELPDVNAKGVNLASLQGKVVLVDFTVYQAQNSPTHNMALNKIYTRFKPDLEIYQVSFDSDVHFWKNAAVNLPWVAVHENKSVNSDLIFKFNIQGFPTLYLINRNGDIVKRLLPTDNIEDEIKKII